MNAINPSGYDAAQANRLEDDLDRWRFAAQIVEVIVSTPSDWSVRLGIFGKWGEGKTTVLRFAEQMLQEKDNVVFRFSPWAIQNWNDLWEDFGSHLLEALSTADIPFDGSWKKSIKDSGKWLESRGVGRVAELGAAFFGREKLYNAAFGVLGRWLRYDGAQIRAIRQKLQNRRLVVLIDDLDRCAPDLLPQLLLSLRELLDLPGFTFLLAFDDEIVSESLTNNNPAWKQGSDFLEKILDFRFHLPPVTELQKERFTSRAMAKYCPFVPAESTNTVLDLLPTNPRKLKALIRSLAALKPQISRHDPDELNWVDMWLAQMIRLESYAFYERLLRGDTLEKEAGAYYRVFHGRSRNRPQEEKEENEGLKRLIHDSGVEADVTVSRLIQLIEAARSRSSPRFKYICELALRPHAVTWKEFRSFYGLWLTDRHAQVFSRWTEEHARVRNVSIDDVEQEIFHAIVMRRQECLSEASDSTAVQEHDLKIDEALNLLQMEEQFLLDLAKLTAPRFRQLWGQSRYWIHFSKDARDRTLREKEESLLVKLLGAASPSMSLELFEVISPEDPALDFGEGVAQKTALSHKCMAILGPKVAKEAIAFFGRKGGIQNITEAGRFRAIKYSLFRPDSPVWKTSLRDDLLGRLREGLDIFDVFVNVRYYFNLLLQGLARGLDWVAREDIASLLADHEFVSLLWQIVTSRGVQYRMQSAYLQARRTFIGHGVPESTLPLAEEPQLRLKEEESETSRSSEGV